MAVVLAEALDAPDAGPEMQTVVTATRLARPNRQVPMTVVVMPRAELERSAALTTDGLLRTEPSVATFRRNTSLGADPTAQGLNLRGIGPSGVSRTLVLVDGLAANDPFGGWVFWRSLPRFGLERIEIMPGPGSALYGSSALGGVVQLISRAPTESAVEAEGFAGTLGTLGLTARGAAVWSAGSVSLEGGVLRSDGYRIVSPEKAGSVDGPTRSDDLNLSARIELRPRDGSRLGARLSYFNQRQNGGTTFTDSRIELFGAATTYAWAAPTGGHLQASLSLRVGHFEQRRARVAADRNSEVLVADQRVPLAEQGGGLAYHFAPLVLGGRHSFSAGLDLRRATGLSRERSFADDAAVTEREAGGEQQFGGLFIQDLWSLSETVELLGSLRGDLWRNVNGRSDSVTFADRADGQLSPRLGVLWQPLHWLALRTSGGTGFRAPTLNELYRPFQVGTIVTGANEALRAERLIGGEVGVEVTPLDGLVARVTGFSNRLERPVTNVTLSEPLSSGATRQRQNLGAARIQGIEASVGARFLKRFTVLVGYAFIDARVVEAGTTGLSGKQLAQDPQHRGSASVTFDDPRYVTATVQTRVVGPQFEDDLNTLPMGGFVVVDLSVGRRLWRGVELFGAVENVFNRRYLVGRAGLDTYGPPLMARVGVRLRSEPGL